MKRAIFLDRDGVINKDVGYLREKAKFEYVEGAVESLRYLQKVGFVLVIITNQSGIARGLFTETEYQELETWIECDLKTNGVNIAASYYCPHHPAGIVPQYRMKCSCRKPESGLFYRAAKELDINLDTSYAIGDRLRDLCICDKAKTVGFLLNPDNSAEKSNGVICCKSWKEVVGAISKREVFFPVS